MAKVKICKIKDVKTPVYAKPGDAGFDLCSAESFVLKPNERHGFETGLKMEIPEGHVGLIWDRSGLAFNDGIKTMAGVIDSSYRGEVKVVLTNLGNRDFEVKKGMRIAQMLIQKIEQAEIVLTDSISETDRGEGGFGSSGLH